MTVSKVQIQNVVAMKFIRAEIQGQLHLQQSQLQQFFMQEAKMKVLKEVMNDLNINDSYFQLMLETLRKGEEYVES